MYIPGLISTSEQFCSAHRSVDRFSSSGLAGDTQLLKDDNNGSTNKLNCMKTVKEIITNYYSMYMKQMHERIQSKTSSSHWFFRIRNHQTSP